tara:strand:+ start:108 stop:458 length:351 start_codon:yes stop_codon:yes gene_type:complete
VSLTEIAMTSTHTWKRHTIHINIEKQHHLQKENHLYAGTPMAVASIGAKKLGVAQNSHVTAERRVNPHATSATAACKTRNVITNAIGFVAHRGMTFALRTLDKYLWKNNPTCNVMG